MDQSTGNVEHNPAEDPADDEYKKEREKHETSHDMPNGGGSAQGFLLVDSGNVLRVLRSIPPLRKPRDLEQVVELRVGQLAQ